MAPKTKFGHLGLLCSLLGCFLFFPQSSSASESSFPSYIQSETVKVSELPRPSLGTLGLNSLIYPTEQLTVVTIEYPHYSKPVFANHTTYQADATIDFICTARTRRIAVYANPKWSLKSIRVYDFTSQTQLELDKYYFDPEPEMLYIDTRSDLTPGSYSVRISLDTHVIEDDRFGIQAFTQTWLDEDSYKTESYITVSLSGGPKIMRRFVPCFDHPKYIIPLRWTIGVYHGDYPPNLVMMNGPVIGVDHRCDLGFATRYNRYAYYIQENMAIEATQLQIVPFRWYVYNNYSRPPNNCPL